MCLAEVELINCNNKLYLQYEDKAYVYKKEVTKVNAKFICELDGEALFGNLADIKEAWYYQISKGKGVIISSHRF